MRKFICALLCTGLALSFGACSGKSKTIGDGGSDGGNTSCTSVSDCTGMQVCNPSNSACTDTLACTTQTACGAGAYCSTAATCVPSEAGTANTCGSNDNCVGGETCTNAGHCGCDGTKYTPSRVKPNMTILLDRSGSMDYCIDDTLAGDPDATCTTADNKWASACSTIALLLNGDATHKGYGDEIRFGLAVYPNDHAIDSCTFDGPKACTNHHASAGRVFVYPKDGTASDIVTDLGLAKECDGTPIAATLTVLKNDPVLWDDTRLNYVLLVTDGEENCSDTANSTAPVAAAKALYDGDPQVKTFVIGLHVNSQTLENIAIQGGTTQSYPVDEIDKLYDAFNNIAGSIVSCTYALTKAPTDPSLVNVYEGDTLIKQDTTHSNGWDYVDSTDTQILLYGQACTNLKDGTAGDVSIVEGCTTVVPL